MSCATGTALFLVDRKAPGVAVDSYALIDGSWAADVVFDKVRLANDALVADGIDGTALLAEAIDRATVALVGQAVGSMEPTTAGVHCPTRGAPHPPMLPGVE